MVLHKRSFIRMEVPQAMLDTMPCLRMHPSEAIQKNVMNHTKYGLFITIIVKIDQGTCYYVFVLT